MFKKGDKVVKVIDVKGHKSATVEEIASVKKGVVSLVDSGLKYDNTTGHEVDSAFVGMGISSQIIKFDDGEIERLGL